LIPASISAQDDENPAVGPVYYGFPEHELGKIFITTRMFGDSTRFYFIEFFSDPFANLTGEGCLLISSFDGKEKEFLFFDYVYSPANQLIMVTVSDRAKTLENTIPTFTMEFEATTEFGSKLVWRGPNYQNYLMKEYSYEFIYEPRRRR
jgi:hypothetical protein